MNDNHKDFHELHGVSDGIFVGDKLLVHPVQCARCGELVELDDTIHDPDYHDCPSPEKACDQFLCEDCCGEIIRD